MATITLTLDVPVKDFDWLRKLELGTELVIVKERGNDSGLVPQAILVHSEEAKDD